MPDVPINMEADVVYKTSNGDLTKAFYARMNKHGFFGQLAVALFRAQKRSDAAKRYRGGKFKGAAYEVKNWSLSEICRILLSNNKHGIVWGWGEDPKTIGFPYVLYVDLPTGQVSFHSAERLQGPDYTKPWDGKHLSAERIIRFAGEALMLPEAK